jgi:hypothetical protein
VFLYQGVVSATVPISLLSYRKNMYCFLYLIHGQSSGGGGFPCVKKSDSRFRLISRESSR